MLQYYSVEYLIINKIMIIDKMYCISFFDKNKKNIKFEALIRLPLNKIKIRGQLFR